MQTLLKKTAVVTLILNKVYVKARYTGFIYQKYEGCLENIQPCNHSLYIDNGWIFSTQPHM